MSKTARWFAIVMSCVAAAIIISCDRSTTTTITPTPSTLAISPTIVTIAQTVVTNVSFTASGGASNYVWSLSDPTLGDLVAADNTAIYQNTTGVGANVITVTDASNNTASATVVQM